MRKLATIREIVEIRPIEGADFIESARVDGWWCVVKKGEFALKDKVIYCEVDSFLPLDERYEFLRKTSYKKMLDDEGYRLRSVRLRSQLSQGLLLPLHSFPELVNCQVGDDVTDLLKIKLYEKPIPACLAGEAVGALPSFLIKSDQSRIQNELKYFEMYYDEEFEETEKLDGTSTTFYYNENRFGVCGHNWEWRDTPNNTYWAVAKKLNIEETLKSIGENVGIQGEIIGEGIQKNLYRVKGHQFHVYDIINIAERRFMLPHERMEFMEKLWWAHNPNILHVPVINSRIKILQKTLDEALQYANSNSVLNSKTIREGIVLKSCVRNISFKIISNSFLLEHE